MTACQVAPKYRAPCPCVPEEWKTEQVCDNPPCTIDNWWEVFQDQELNRLEIQAIGNNPKLWLALARIEEAQSIEMIARSPLFPSVDMQPSYYDTGQLFKIYLPNTATTVGPTPFTFLATPYRIHQYQYQLPLNLNYEIDLWGKNRKQAEAAEHNTEAQKEAYLAAMLSLTADVASAYYNIKTLLATEKLYQKIIATYRNDYGLNVSRHGKGLYNSLSVTTAYDTLSQAEANYLDIQSQIELQKNLLAALLGLPPSQLCIEVETLDTFPPCIPAGVPSKVLVRRPDVAQAEREMATQHAQYGADYASLFPSLSLTGTLGYLSPDVREFLQWISRWWAMGVGIDQTIFDGGRKLGNIDASWSKFKEASASYQQTVVTAIKEVEDALVRLQFENQQILIMGQALDASKQTYAVSLQRYEKGLTSSDESLNNERAELNIESNYINLVGQKFQATIQLIKALGGSWDC